MSAPMPREQFGRLALAETEVLGQLRAEVEKRSGTDAADALYSSAAAAFHRLFDAAGAYTSRPEGT